MVSKDNEVVCKKAGSSAREHVVLCITTVKADKKPSEPPPTFVAQTKKHGEKQILKQHVDEVAIKIDKIRREQGEHALPVNKARAAKAKWKSIARMTMLSGEFTPAFPSNLSLDPSSFCTAFPYHMVFNKDMHVVHSGVKIQECMPGIRSLLARGDFYFDLLHPPQVDFTFENIKKFINTPFVVRCKKAKMKKDWGFRPLLILRGQMVPLKDESYVIYLCSPFVRSLRDLETRRMHLADIPIHDVTRDMLWMELLARYKFGNLKATTPPPVQHPDDVAPLPEVKEKDDRMIMREVVVAPALVASPGVNEDDLAAEMARLRNGWDTEKRRNADLYRTFLPPKHLAQWESGQNMEAGYYDSTTVLFSDVVCFSDIMAR